MTVSVKPLVNAKLAENADTTQYIAPTGTRAIIDKATVTNITANSAIYTVHIVPSGQSPATSNRVLNARAIAAGECYTCPELTGHVVEPGGFISTVAGTASALAIRISGREVT